MSAHNKVDMIGLRFNRLVVLEEVEPYIQNGQIRATRYLCLCDCGNTKVVLGKSLRCKWTMSCGCLVKETSRRILRQYGSQYNNQKGHAPGRTLHAATTVLWNTYKKGARNRGYEWLLTREVFEKLVKIPCFYCGAPPSNTISQYPKEFLFSGIDRFDNEVGYTEQNCVPCCSVCNYSKRTRHGTEFMAHIVRQYIHISKRGP